MKQKNKIILNAVWYKSYKLDFYKETGNLILATRLRRLSEKFINEISLIYKHSKVNFETSWFPVFYLLSKENVLTLSQISEKLEITHSAVSQMITNLRKKGLVEVLSDNIDERKKYIQLTPISKKMLPQLNRMWDILESSLTNQFPSIAEQNRFMMTLDSLEDKLANNALSQETITKISKANQLIRILPYTIKYKHSLTEFLEKIHFPETSFKFQDIFMAVSSENAVLGLVLFKRAGRNVVINHLLLDRSNENSAIVKAIFEYLTIKYFKKNAGYFILKSPKEQLPSYLLKLKFPFMVKF